MTVSSTTSRWDFTGDGSTTIFAYDNKIFTSAELLVYVAGVLQTETTHYSVSGAGTDGGGNVTFVTAPTNDAAVAILRNVANTQPAELPASGPLPSSSIEDSLDRRAIISQQQAESSDRALKFLESDVSLPSAELPALSTLKGKVLSFDATTGAPEGTSFGDISVAIDVVETTLTDNDFMVYDGSNWVNEAPAAARTSMGLGTAAVADTGVANGDVPGMDATGYPAADGSQITALDPTNIVQVGAGILGAAGAGATSERTAAQVLAFLGYKSNSSLSNAVPAAGGNVTLTHGFGASPNNLSVFLRCTTADSPFAVGDGVDVTGHIVIDGTSEFGLMVMFDATEVKVVRGANALNIYHQTSGETFAIDTADWVIDIHARILP